MMHHSFRRLQTHTNLPAFQPLCSLIFTDGPERNTIQWSSDGVNFEIKSHIKWGPPAAGLVRELDFEAHPVEALKSGLTHEYVSYDWQKIMRFEYKQPLPHNTKLLSFVDYGLLTNNNQQLSH